MLIFPQLLWLNSMYRNPYFKIYSSIRSLINGDFCFSVRFPTKVPNIPADPQMSYKTLYKTYILWKDLQVALIDILHPDLHKNPPIPKALEADKVPLREVVSIPLIKIL